MSKKFNLLISLTAILVVVFVILVMRPSWFARKPDVSNRVQTFQGKAVCLLSSPTQRGCIFGIEQGNGKVYQLADLASRYPEKVRESLRGQQITVRGKLMPPPAPAENLPQNPPGNLEGVIQVEEIPQAEEILSMPDEQQPQTGVSSGGVVEVGPGISIDQSTTGLHTVPDLPIDGALPSGPLTVKYVIEHRSALSQSRATVTVKGVLVAVQAVLDTLCPQKGSGILAPCAVTSRIVLADSGSSNRDLNYDLPIIVNDAGLYKVGQEMQILGTIVGSSTQVYMQAVKAGDETQ